MRPFDTATRLVGVGLLLLLLLLAMSRMPPIRGAPSIAHLSGAGNIDGQVLVLDVASLRSNSSPLLPAFADARPCRDACAGLPGCNAWTFCTKKGGCGHGCAEYVQQHPQLPASPAANASAGALLPNPAWRLPLTGFGPWGATAACASNSSWPQGMCSLKRVTDPVSPRYWSRDPKEGWASGTISTPAACNGTAAAACQACLVTTRAAECLACARRSSAALPGANPVLLVVLGNSSSGSASGCAG